MSMLARKKQNWRVLLRQHIFSDGNGIIYAIDRKERLSPMEMKKIAFFDTKPYDKESFERQNNAQEP